MYFKENGGILDVASNDYIQNCFAIWERAGGQDAEKKQGITLVFRFFIIYLVLRCLIGLSPQITYGDWMRSSRF